MCFEYLYDKITLYGAKIMLIYLCFEIIETCPNNCLFCSSCSSITKDRKIEYAKFKEVIDYFIRTCGIEEISLSGGRTFITS